MLPRGSTTTGALPASTASCAFKRTDKLHAERIQRSASASTSNRDSKSLSSTKREAIFALSSSSFLFFLLSARPASASIPTKQRVRRPLQPPSPRDKESSVSVVQDAAEVARLISLAKTQGLEEKNWQLARESFTKAANFRNTVASAELARVPAALALAELGKPEEALLELEDAFAEGTSALKGRAELHAALAALRYSLKRKGAEGESY